MWFAPRSGVGLNDLLAPTRGANLLPLIVLLRGDTKQVPVLRRVPVRVDLRKRPQVIALMNPASLFRLDALRPLVVAGQDAISVLQGRAKELQALSLAPRTEVCVEAA